MKTVMIDDRITERIHKFEQLYELRWGKPVDFLALPKNISQENLCFVLEKIVNSGESILVGWSKYRK